VRVKPQRTRSFDPAMFFDGLMVIVFGLFRKCVIADNRCDSPLLTFPPVR